MKQFLLHRRYILMQALHSGCTISILIYVGLRLFFYEFPFTWVEEILFFVQMFFASCLVITSASTGCALLHEASASKKNTGRFK